MPRTVIPALSPMRSFRRSPGAEHLVHAVELPELARRRRPVATRDEAGSMQARSDADMAGRGAHSPGPAQGPNGVHPFRAQRAGGQALALVRGIAHEETELRALDVPRPPALAPEMTAAAVVPGARDAAPEDAGRIDLLERRLAKLTRLLEERDEQLQLRMESAPREHGVASIYSDVQGLRGQSEEALRKRSLMSSIFEANRKLRERIGSTAQEAE